jgi:hypothetical protein
MICINNDGATVASGGAAEISIHVETDFGVQTQRMAMEVKAFQWKRWRTHTAGMGSGNALTSRASSQESTYGNHFITAATIEG